MVWYEVTSEQMVKIMNFRKLWFVYPWMLCVLFSIAIHIRLSPYAHDDAYIYLRIADHLARFGVPYFNLNEAVQANSSVAWLLVLATVFKFTSANIVVIAILNGLFTATAALVYTRLLRDLIGQRIQTAVYLLFFFLFFFVVPRTSLIGFRAVIQHPFDRLAIGDERFQRNNRARVAKSKLSQK